MISDFVAFARGARNDIGMLDHIFANHKESRFDVIGGEEIEQLWRELRLRAVVESHGDVGAIDVDRIESDARLGLGVRFVFLCWLRCGPVFGSDIARRKPEEATKNEQTENKHERRRQTDASI